MRRALRGTMMTINSGAGGYVSFLIETLDRHDWASVPSRGHVNYIDMNCFKKSKYSLVQKFKGLKVKCNNLMDLF